MFLYAIQEEVFVNLQEILNVMIGKYIHKLLLENETVIIPGFGAFVSNYKPAEIDEETNELKPPSKEISFNQQIRNNDGLLVGCIADGEGISHFDALKNIEKERENIIYQLDKGEKVVLEETGELFFNEHNEIQFEPFEDENLLLDSFGLESILLEDRIKEQKEAEPIIEPVIHEKIEKTEVEPVIHLEEKEPDPIIKKAEPPVLDAPIADELKNNEKKKKRSSLWLLLILAPIIIVGVFIINQNSNTEKDEALEKETTLINKEKPRLNADSVIVDSISATNKDSTIVEETEIDSNVIAIPDSPKFYLVGGSFKEEKNAEKYVEQLREKGFNSFQLGKRGNFYVIGIGEYETELEAVSAKQEFVKKNPGSGVWIMEGN
ncbi:MAG: SPOR domain-containing protein [Bacteroidales bacterium]|nr:SPOR domain-containing protein [Bacteroidales bacterium]